MTSHVASREAGAATLASLRAGHRALATIAVTGLLFLLLAVVLSLSVGAQTLSPSTVWASLLGQGDSTAQGIVDKRIDRTVIGLVVGACVALSGALLQGLTRNPIAEPGILGLSAGASLVVVLGIHAGWLVSTSGYVWAAMVGVLLAGALVHAISLTVPVQRQPMATALGGAAVMALATSVIAGLLVTSQDTLDTFRFWQVGSVAGRDASILLQVAPFVVVGLVLALTAGRTLNAMALGDDLARALGQHVLLHRGAALLGVLLLTASATAVAGPIAFVGLVVPHLVRLIGGPDYRRVLLGSLLGGPALVVLADTLGRIVLPPSEVQVGIMSAVVGAPVLVMLARRSATRGSR